MAVSDPLPRPELATLRNIPDVEFMQLVDAAMDAAEPEVRRKLQKALDDLQAAWKKRKSVEAAAGLAVLLRTDVTRLKFHQLQSIDRDFARFAEAVFDAVMPLQHVYLQGWKEGLRIASALELLHPMARQMSRDWAEANAGRLVREVSESTRKAIGGLVADGFELGHDKAWIQKHVREMVGLTKHQAAPILQQISERFEAGNPMSEHEIRRLIKNRIRQRAGVIAEHESATAGNHGIRNAWASLRDDHGAKIGHLDGFYVSRTGETSTGPTLHVRCRCGERLTRVGRGEYVSEWVVRRVRNRPCPRCEAFDGILKQGGRETEWAARKAQEKKTRRQIEAYGPLEHAITKAQIDALTPGAARVLLPKAEAAAQRVATQLLKPKAPRRPRIPTADVDVDQKHWKKVGGQGGSNDGALYENATNGERWYVKTPATEDHARNEVLAAQLYRAAGVDVPDVVLATRNGKVSVASKIVDGLEKTGPGQLRDAGAGRGFAVDAWLSNWDVVGLSYDNMLVRDGKAFRLDTGGAMVFRAQGAKKLDHQFLASKSVGELDDLRKAAINPQASSVFADLQVDELVEGMDRVLSVTPEQIRDLVAAVGPRGKLGDDIAEALIRRQGFVREIRHSTYEGIESGLKLQNAPKPKTLPEVLDLANDPDTPHLVRAILLDEAEGMQDALTKATSAILDDALKATKDDLAALDAILPGESAAIRQTILEEFQTWNDTHQPWVVLEWAASSAPKPNWVLYDELAEVVAKYKAKKSLATSHMNAGNFNALAEFRPFFNDFRWKVVQAKAKKANLDRLNYHQGKLTQLVKESGDVDITLDSAVDDLTAKVSKALDQQIEANDDLAKLLPEGHELEVSWNALNASQVKAHQELSTLLKHAKGYADQKAAEAAKAAVSVGEKIQKKVGAVRTMKGQKWVQVDDVGVGRNVEVYQTPSGVKWAVRVDSPESVAEQLAANRLYKLLDVDVAEMQRVELADGRVGVAFKLGKNPKQLSLTDPPDSWANGFAADALLGNWSAIASPSSRPMSFLDGKTARRADMANALRLRLTGGWKGHLFGPKVVEVDTLLGAQNKHSSVYLKLADAARKKQAKKAAKKLTEEAIDTILESIPDLSDRAALKQLLLKRRDSLNEWAHSIAKKHTAPKVSAHSVAAAGPDGTELVDGLFASWQNGEKWGSSKSGPSGPAAEQDFERWRVTVGQSSYQDAWTADLPAADLQAVRGYTGSGYARINSQLRSAGEGDHLGKGSNAWRIRRSLAQSEAQADQILWRFTTWEGWDNAAVGDVVADWGFSSTSALEWRTMGFGRTEIKIRVRKGTKGIAYVRPWSNFSSEMEYVLQRGSHFRVIDKGVYPDGRPWLEVEWLGGDNGTGKWEPQEAAP